LRCVPSAVTSFVPVIRLGSLYYGSRGCITFIPAFSLSANALLVDFYKEQFNRAPAGSSENPHGDPPDEVIYRAANSVLLRIRSLMRAPGIKAVGPTTVVWRLHHLYDDGTPTIDSIWPGPDRQYLALRGSLGAVHEAIWTAVTTLPTEHVPFTWETLLNDAYMLLPEIGPAVTLTSTALETIIAVALDRLAAESQVSPELWEWITHRGDYRKEPSESEQWDVLLGVLTGRSLKSENRLWELFQRLRDVRNNFVHTGRVVYGRRESELTEQEARDLVDAARDIIDWLYPMLPEELRRPLVGEGEMQIAPQKRWQ